MSIASVKLEVGRLTAGLACPINTATAHRTVVGRRPSPYVVGSTPYEWSIIQEYLRLRRDTFMCPSPLDLASTYADIVSNHDAPPLQGNPEG
ncbi:hypothetical protein BDW66DRAFT_128357 [Aspergillus desertorum]